MRGENLLRCIVGLPLAALFAALVASCASVSEPTIAAGWPADKAALPLSHADCVDLALASAPSAAAWRARRMSAEAALRQAQAYPNPLFTASWENFGVSRAPGLPVEQTFSLSLALADLFARQYKMSAAEANLAAEEAALVIERRDLAAEVRHAYDQLVAARDRFRLREDLVAAAERQRSVAERLVSLGLSPRIEADRAATEGLQASADLARAASEARIQELALAFALGFEAPVTLALSEPMTSLEAGQIAEASASAPAAIVARPEVAVAKARYDEALARTQLAAQRFQLLPTVSAGYRRAESSDLGVAGFEIPVPIFDAGAAAEDEQSAALLAAASNLEQAVRRAGAEMLQAETRARDAHDLLTKHAQQLADRRHNLAAASERLFAAGEIPYDSVLLARRDEITARLDLVEAQANAAAASVDLSRVVERQWQEQEQRR